MTDLKKSYCGAVTIDPNNPSVANIPAGWFYLNGKRVEWEASSVDVGAEHSRLIETLLEDSK